VWALVEMSRSDQLALVTLVYGMGSAIALADGHSVDPTATGVGLLALPLVSASVHYANEYADYFADYLAVRTPFSGGVGRSSVPVFPWYTRRRSPFPTVAAVVLTAVAQTAAWLWVAQ
jgi:1,4-dihydroxy-2-naphthoate octaprenyltransferase